MGSFGGEVMKKITFFMVALTLFVFIGMSLFSSPLLANTANNTVEERDVYLNIMASNKSQYKMIQKITGDKHNIQYMFSTEEEIKNYKLVDKALENISNMDLFFYTGNNYEPWSGEFINKLKKGQIGIIDISRGMRVLTNQVGETTHDNPYYWLGLEEYKIALYNIKSAIQDRDPKNRQYYEDNYNNALNDFKEKLDEYKDLSKISKDVKFVVIGDDFDYLFKGVGVEYIKATNENLNKVVASNKLNLEKVAIIKDKDLVLESTLPFKHIINLEKFNGEKSSDEIIYFNIEEMLKINK